MQMFKETLNINKHKMHSEVTGNVLKIGVSKEMLFWSFSGSSKVIGSTPKVVAEAYLNINGKPINLSSCD